MIFNRGNLKKGNIVLIRFGRGHSRSMNPKGKIKVRITNFVNDGMYDFRANATMSNGLSDYYYNFSEILKICEEQKHKGKRVGEFWAQ